MKYTLAAMVALIEFADQGCGRSPGVAVADSTPRVSFLVDGGEQFNAGLIKEGDTVEHVFRVTNVSDRVVAFTRTVTSCGCLSVTVSPTIVEPLNVCEVHLRL